MRLKRLALVILCIIPLSSSVCCASNEGLAVGAGVSYHAVLWQAPSFFYEFTSGYWAGVVISYGFGAFNLRGAVTVIDLETLRIEHEPQLSVWLDTQVASVGPVGLYVGGRLNIDPFENWTGATLTFDLAISPIRFTEVRVGVGYEWTLFPASVDLRGLYLGVGVLTTLPLAQ